MIFVACDCPISNGYAPEYVRLDKQLKSSGGRLVLVYSNPGDLAGAQKHAAKFNLGGISQVLDDDQSLLKRLGATTTPEAFILDEKRVVRYCGSIDDKYVERGKPTAGVRRKFLSDALSQVMDGKFVLNPRTEAFGCAIESKKTVAEAGAPTYAADVAPILNANCVSCHREGETAPMPLDTFEAARRFAGQYRRDHGSKADAALEADRGPRRLQRDPAPHRRPDRDADEVGRRAARRRATCSKRPLRPGSRRAGRSASPT